MNTIPNDAVKTQLPDTITFFPPEVDTTNEFDVPEAIVLSTDVTMLDTVTLPPTLNSDTDCACE